MLTFKSLVALLALLGALIVAIVQRRSHRTNRSKSPTVIRKSGTEGDVNKNWLPRGE
jgi:hypothetical protein